MAEETGQRVGDYEVLALLGAGGMGRVYKVRNIISNREEAMKVLLPDFAAEPELAARFMAEIRTLAGLEHPNIAQLRTAFEFQNQFVMVMEFVEGTTLEKLAQMTRIPLDHALDIALQGLAALSYAHSRGVTHRDIKPANLMITPHGVVKLMDFGIAKSTTDLNLTRPGTTMGSVYYMSPEQVRGGSIDARSDIYSFGVMLYEMLTGRKPFQGDTSYGVLNAQLNEAPPPLSQFNAELPARLNEIVLRSMAKQPEERFQTAEEFRGALKGLREPQSAPQVAPQPAPAVAEPARPAAEAWQGYAPVPIAAQAAAAKAGKSSRGLWLVLGAVTAVLALVAVAALVPRFLAARAGQQPAPTATETKTPAVAPDAAAVPPQGAAAPDAAQPANSDAGSAPAAAPATGNAAAREAAGSQSAPGAEPGPHATSNRMRKGGEVRMPYTAGAPAASDAGGTAAPAGPSKEEIREARDRMITLSSRADAAQSGVQQLRSQQQAQGLDLRGDIVASMNRMRMFRDEASRALNQNDIQTANEYLEKAEREAAILEKFLGR